DMPFPAPPAEILNRTFGCNFLKSSLHKTTIGYSANAPEIEIFPMYPVFSSYPSFTFGAQEPDKKTIKKLNISSLYLFFNSSIFNGFKKFLQIYTKLIDFI